MQNERKKLEYEARQKAIRDYNSQMSSSFKNGEKRVNNLYEKLMNDGRMEELNKAISDESYREKLYKEYLHRK